jgi:hypothetical protein
MSDFYDDIVSDEVAPPWLQQGAYGQGNGVGGRYLQTIGVELSTIANRARQAILNPMPGKGDPSALPLIAADRLIVLGSSESNVAAAARLQTAFDFWRVAGGDWAVLAEIASLFSGFTNGVPSIRIVDDTSEWSFYGANPNLSVPPLYAPARVANWNWDNHAEWTGLAAGQGPWYRYWIVIDCFGPTSFCSEDGNWGSGGNWGDGNAWGVSIPNTLFLQMQRVLKIWQQAGAWCRWIVLNFQTGNYLVDSPNATPDGTWAFWGKQVNSVRVQSRDTTARYADGALAGS